MRKELMDMKVLIVDDDPNTVRLIEESVGWKRYGIGQVDTAYQGNTALEIVRTERPEIIISDIEMPQMDGMELLEQVAGIYAEMPEFIFLTCHDSFAFAKQAIRYGVTAYLLKPFQVEELIAVLSAAVVRQQKKSSEQKLLRQWESLRENEDYVQQAFLRRVLDGTLEPALMEGEIKKRQIRFSLNANYYLIYVGINGGQAGEAGFSEADINFIFRNITAEILYGQIDYQRILEYNLKSYYVLAGVLEEGVCSRDELIRKAQRLIRIGETHMRLKVSAAVSDAVEAAGLGELKRKMDDFFLISAPFQSGVAVLEEEGDRKEHSGGELDQERFSSLLREGKKSELITWIRNLLQKAKEEGRLDGYYMRNLHHDLMQGFYEYLSENHIFARQLFVDGQSQTVNETAEASVMDMLRYLNYMYDCTVRQIAETREAATVVSRARRYIEENYQKQIGRNEIAAHVFLAPNYLSRLFHDQMNMSLREYINTCRIEEAKKLLLSTEKSVTDIALQVGFENIPYFSTIFRKMCGTTPAAWKAAHIGGD